MKHTFLTSSGGQAGKAPVNHSCVHSKHHSLQQLRQQALEVQIPRVKALAQGLEPLWAAGQNS
eukprot:scaffold29675_cov18-Tisochrysis_lutea.AAC.1